MIKTIGAVTLATAIGIALVQHAGAQSPEQTPDAPAAAPATPPGEQGTAVQAGDRPSTVEDCLKRLNDVVTHALTLKLPDEKVEKAETALATMEQSCVDQNFAEASATESDIRRIIAEGSSATDGK